MPPTTPPAEEHACPRCGYDLASLRPDDPAAPLVCPECGVRTSWRAMNDPDRHARRWHLELAEDGLLRAGVRTAVVCLFPAWLWEWVPLELPIRRGRLIAFTLAHLAMISAAIGAVAAYEAPRRSWYQPVRGVIPLVAAGILPRPPTSPPATADQVADLDRRFIQAFQVRSFGGLQASGATGPLATLHEWLAEQGLTIPDAAAQRWADAANAAQPQVFAAVDKAEERASRIDRVRAFFMPFATQSLSIRRSWFPWTQAETLARLGIIANLLLPLSLLVLRSSLRAARVRPVHLLRGFAYGTPGVLLLAAGVLLPAALLAGPARGGLPFPARELAALSVLLVLPFAGLCLAWMWAQFLGGYLRLADAGRVFLATAALSISGALLFVYFLWDRGGVEGLLGVW